MTQVKWWSVTMVTRYDVITSRWSSHFWLKMHFFQFFSTMKVKLMDEMMQSNYWCVILHVKRLLLILTVFTWFLMLDKIQDSGQDGDHVWWRHRLPAAPLPMKYISSCREDQRLSTEGKIVLKYCNISKTQGEVPSTPLPCTTVGVLLYVYFQGLNSRNIIKTNN